MTLFRRLKLRNIPLTQITRRTFTTIQSDVIEGSRRARFRFWDNILFRRVFRFSRTVVLLSSVVATTYSLGQIDYIDDPMTFEKKALKSILLKLNCNRVVIAGEHEKISNLKVIDVRTGQDELKASEDLLQAAKVTQLVFKKVKTAAIKELDEILRNLETDMKSKQLETPGLLSSLPDASAASEGLMKNVPLNLVQSEYQLFKRKRRALDQEWSIVVLDEEQPNAFVSGFLPNIVFISKGMLRYFTRDEAQLSLVLSHEMSHFLLGHTKNMLMFDAAVKIAVISVFSLIDISGGLGSFISELVVPYLGSLVGKGYNREQEGNADQMGLRITTRACYKPEKAIQLYANMKRYNDATTAQNIVTAMSESLDTALFSSHPVTKQRFEVALQQVNTQKQAYKAYGCDQSLIQKFYHLVMNSEEKEDILLPQDAPKGLNVAVEEISVGSTK